jgi:hypothetical protein
MDALRDVSREVVPGNLKIALENGLLKDSEGNDQHKKENLEVAY